MVMVSNESNILASFISEEKDRYEAEDAKLLESSAWQVKRAYDFILLVAGRVMTENTTYKELLTRLPQTAEATHVKTSEPPKILGQLSVVGQLIELDMKSFYIFSKILLDKVAIFLKDYFGEVRKLKLDSHDKFTKNHEKFGAAKGVTYPLSFATSLLRLQELICDYRDKDVEHVKTPYMMEGIIQSRNGEPRLVRNRLYRKIFDPAVDQIESKELPELLQSIDTYLQKVFTVVELNRAKSKFKLKSC